jgi:lysine-specific permease
VNRTPLWLLVWFLFVFVLLDYALNPRYRVTILFIFLFIIELSSAATVIRFWGKVMPDAAWASIFWVLVFSLNMFSVR